ncbi:MAG: hypothetical protein AB2L12_15570 [Smithellaceae bacterium]
MVNKLKFNIPEKVLRRLIICAGIIIFFVLAGIIPLSRYNAFLNKDIKKLQSQIEEQKNLNSTYAILIKNMEKKNLRILPNPVKTTFPRQEASKFQDVFREIAEKSGLKTISVSPEVSALTGSSNYLLHTAIAKGEFVNFRKMLIELGYLPYLEKIEEISIQQYPDALEFKMKILIALGN